jgi:hypothetical protein
MILLLAKFQIFQGTPSACYTFKAHAQDARSTGLPSHPNARSHRLNLGTATYWRHITNIIQDMSISAECLYEIPAHSCRPNCKMDCAASGKGVSHHLSNTFTDFTTHKEFSCPLHLPLSLLLTTPLLLSYSLLQLKSFRVSRRLHQTTTTMASRPHLTPTYRRYKRGIAEDVQWIANAALSTGTADDILPKSSGSRVKGAARKEQAAKLKNTPPTIAALSIKTLQELTKLIKKVSIRIPRRILATLWDVICSRKECAEWHSAFTDPLDHKTKTSNTSRRFFIQSLRNRTMTSHP